MADGNVSLNFLANGSSYFLDKPVLHHWQLRQVVQGVGAQGEHQNQNQQSFNPFPQSGVIG